jgi:hypothetical protein
MIDWDSFIIRRSINFAEFSRQFNIKSVGDLLNVCQKLSVKPPTDLQILSLFPPKKEEVAIVETIVENEVNEVVTKKSKKTQGVEK